MKNSARFLKTALTVLLSLLLLPAQAMKPDRVYFQTPDSLGLAYTARTVTTTDGYRLNSWEIAPAKAGRAVAVVLAYQDFGNMSYYLQQARALSRAGYAVVLFDYRGFGQSADFPLNLSQLYYQEFATDLQTVVAATRQRLPRHKVGVLAMSMGTIVATTVAAEQQVDFLVTEGLVTDPTVFAGRVKQFKNRDVALPAGAIDYPPLLARVRCPMLLFAGTQDMFTTLADSQQVAGQGRKRKLVAFNGNHLGGFPALSSRPESADKFGNLYVKQIDVFLRKSGIR